MKKDYSAINETSRRKMGKQIGATIFLWLIFITTASADSLGLQIISELEGDRVEIILSKEGASSVQYGERDGIAEPVRGIILRYSDGALFGIDYSKKALHTTNLSKYIEVQRAEMGRAREAGSAGHKIVEFKRTPAVFSETGEVEVIVGAVKATAVILAENSREWRIWYSPNDLVRASADVQKVLSALVPVDPQSADIFKRMVGQPVVRVDLKIDGKWQPVFKPLSIRMGNVKSSQFDAPTGFADLKPYNSIENIAEMPPGGYQLSANVLISTGPIMPNAEAHIVFWGPSLKKARDSYAMQSIYSALNNAMRPEYIKYLKQYGIDSVDIKGIYTREGAPKRDVGNANFAEIDAMVYNVGFYDQAPLFWWNVGGHDPFYAFLITASEVDNGGWNGYHFLSFSLTHAVLPFPLMMFARDGMPWIIVRVPDIALSLPHLGEFKRSQCRFKPTSDPAHCNALAGMDTASDTIAHEIVEVAVDPYPFFGWIDPGRWPLWTESEIADICQGNPLPWAQQTVIRSSVVATYWSNDDRACVPESRPTVKIFEPAAGQNFSDKLESVVLRGYAEDPLDGPIADRINWQVDGTPIGVASTVNAGMLATGQHLARAAVTNSAGLQGVAEVAFSVSPFVPLVYIDHPATGSTFGSDEVVTLHGRGSYEKGMLPDSALTWTLDDTTGIGTGKTTSHTFQTQGQANVSLTAKTPSGEMAKANIVLNIIAPTGKPSVMIVTPHNGEWFSTRDASGNITNDTQPITFTGQAKDSSGSTSGLTFRWESDYDGFLGEGSTINRSLKSAGCGITRHRITLRVTDSTGKTSSDTILVDTGEVC